MFEIKLSSDCEILVVRYASFMAVNWGRNFHEGINLNETKLNLETHGAFLGGKIQVYLYCLIPFYSGF